MKDRAIFTLAAALMACLCSAVPGYGASQKWLSLGKGEVPGPVQVSVGQTPPKGEAEIVVGVQGVFESRVSAPDGRSYSQLSIPGCGAGAKQVGEPMMPFRSFFLEIPYGVDVSVKLLDGSAKSLGKGFLVYPQQPPIYPGDPKGKPAFKISRPAYATDAFFPASPVVLEKPGIIRGRRVVMVRIFPLQYNPVSGELRAFLSLRFKLQFQGTPDKLGEARKRRLATRTSEALAKRLITNYEPPEKSITGSGAGVLSAEDGADYLIIVADNLYKEIMPLAEWKHKKGFITRVADMNEVGSDCNDVNDFIHNAYHTWDPAPSYVLLVGDAEDVPPQYFDIVGVIGPAPVDNLYSCVDGNDIYPDLTIGRLPVHTELECTNVVNKILTYDRSPDTGEWYDDFLSVSDSDFWVLEGTMQSQMGFLEISSHITGFLESTVRMTTHTAWNLHRYDVEYHFNSNYPHRLPYPDPVPEWILSLCKYPPSVLPPDISQAINGGVSLVQYMGHGNEWKWAYIDYEISHINALYNGSKTPVVFSIACATGHFCWDEGDCFCEAFLKKTPGGCVGIVGATDLAGVYQNNNLINGIYTCFWPSYDPTHADETYPHSWRPAEALTYGKYYLLTYQGWAEDTVKIYHWFGDPEMMLRTETPQTLSVSYDPNVALGKPVDVTVDVNEGGAALEGALIAISHPTAGQDYWTGYTDANGSVTFSDIIFSQCGKYDIVVTAHNCRPYEGTIESYLLADFDDECDVDFEDFAILASQWQQAPGQPSADIAPEGGNGIVDWLDLAVLAENWLAGL